MRPRRRDRGSLLPPEEWPGWVLGPPGSYDPENIEAGFERFYRWRAAKFEWVQAHRPDLVWVRGERVSLAPFTRLASEERRRRVREPRVGTFGQPL